MGRPRISEEEKRARKREYAKRYRKTPHGRAIRKAQERRRIERRRLDPVWLAKEAEKERKRYGSSPEYRERTLAANRASALRRRERLKAIVAEFRALGCALCPEAEPATLCAHHIDPAEKDGLISDMVDRASESRLRAELAKCVCLCHNCHAKLHAGIISLPQP